MEELPSGPGWGGAVGSEPSLALAGDGASPSAFGLLLESPGVCSPSITWENLPTRLQEMQVENCSPELSSGSGKGSMDSTGELLPSLAGMFAGSSSYQPKSAFMVAGQKERRTEGERQLYLQLKDKFKNWQSA